MVKSNWLKIFVLVTFFACNNDKKITMLKVKNDEIKLEVDTLYMPEMAHFPILLKLINNSSYKVILFFDSISNEYENQVRNLTFISNNDTSYILGVRDKYIIFDKHSITSFVCLGYFGDEKGFFNNFSDINNDFPKGKIIYTFSGTIPKNINQEKLLLKADTFLVPNKLEVTTKNVVITEQLYIYPPPVDLQKNK